MIRRTVKRSLARLGYDVRPIADARPSKPAWSRPSDVTMIDEDVLLLLTPPNSGSTAIAKLVGTIPGVVGLGGSSEGQWLVPPLREADRWWPEKYVDYAAVASTWARRIDEIRAERPVEFVLEKSPPNMVRYRDLLGILPNARVVVNNRDPYANVASQIKRYHEAHYPGAPRLDVIAHLADQWRFRSRILRRAHLEDGFPVVGYERFCESPRDILTAFGLEAGDDFAEDAEIRVKDYEPQAIRNMNAEQTARLSPEELDTVSRRLEAEPDLLEFFGYALADPARG
ncbi:sulfotransferase [Microbacter sp. GSS18]|nr:sulfotransferase [Microbacter sp. GSS18]